MTTESPSKWFRFRCSREKTYAMAETPETLRYFNQGHARGKLVIEIDTDRSGADQVATDEYVLATSFWAAEKVPGVGLTREVNR